MELRHPFDDPQGQFTLLRNRQNQYSLWPQQCTLPAGWEVVCAPQSQEACQQWLAEHWQTLLPVHFAGERR